MTWAFGAPRTYEASYGEPIAHDALERTYGAEAADRARSDFPAVQLRMKRLDD